MHVLTSGAFDPFHVGHAKFLRRARSRFGLNMVAIATDAEVAERHPVLVPAEERVKLMRELGYGAFVCEEGVAAAIRLFRPRYFVKGSDWKDLVPTDIVEACKEVGTELKYVRSGSALHSSSLFHD